MRYECTMAYQHALLEWAAPKVGTTDWPEDSVAMGVIDSRTREIQAVIVFNCWVSRCVTIHIASNGKARWATPFTLRCIFSYPFIAMKRLRINAIIDLDHVAAQINALKVGFRFEGTAKCGAEDGGDAVLLGMTRDSCPWITDTDAEGWNARLETQGESHGREELEQPQA